MISLTLKEQGRSYANIADLRLWDKNPKFITDEDYEDLRNSLEKHPIFKPLIVTPEGEIVDGNHRFKVFQGRGDIDTWVHIVEPRSEAHKVEIAALANRQFGQNDPEKWAELGVQIPELDLESIKIDLGKPIKLQAVVTRYAPGETDEKPPKEKQPKIIRCLCPSCGEIFDKEI